MTETTELAKYDGSRPIGTLAVARKIFEGAESKLAEAFPKGAMMTPTQLIASAVMAIKQTPKLKQCSQDSVMRSVIRSAQLGLPCDGTLGQAWLVPFKKTCQLIVGYRGWIALALRDPAILGITDGVVYQGEKCEISGGSHQTVTHEVDLKADRSPSKVVGAYMIVHMTGGVDKVEYMTKAQLDAIRVRSRAKDDGPWVTDTVEMYRKTPIRRGLKYVPMQAAEVRHVLALAEEFDNEVVAIQPPDMDAENAARTEEILGKAEAMEEADAPADPLAHVEAPF